MHCYRKSWIPRIITCDRGSRDSRPITTILLPFGGMHARGDSAIGPSPLRKNGGPYSHPTIHVYGATNTRRFGWLIGSTAKQQAQHVNIVNTIVHREHVRIQVVVCYVSTSHLSKALIADWISIWPALEIRVVEAVKVIDEAGVQVGFFARKAVEVLLRHKARGGKNIAEGVVKILGDDVLRGVDEHRHVAVAVRMVEERVGIQSSRHIVQRH